MADMFFPPELPKFEYDDDLFFPKELPQIDLPEPEQKEKGLDGEGAEALAGYPGKRALKTWIKALDQSDIARLFEKEVGFNSPGRRFYRPGNPG